MQRSWESALRIPMTGLVARSWLGRFAEARFREPSLGNISIAPSVSFTIVNIMKENVLCPLLAISNP
jgi:hypothetical protein